MSKKGSKVLAEDSSNEDSSNEDSYDSARSDVSSSSEPSKEDVTILETDDEDEVVMSENESEGSASDSDTAAIDSDKVKSAKKLSNNRRTLRKSIRSITFKRPDSESEESDDEVALENSIEIPETDDESENEAEKRAFSPRTRMSITGIIPDDLSGEDDDDDDDDDKVNDDDDDDDVVAPRKNIKVTRRIVDSDEESDAEEIDSFNESLPLQNYNPESSPAKQIFESSIKSKLSSTISESTNVSRNVEIFEEEIEKVELLSSDDEKKIVKPKTLIQPSIQSKLINTASKQVSRSFYESEVSKLNTLQSQLVTMEKIFNSKAALPDKGAGLIKKCESLKQDIAELNKTISTLVIEDSMNVKNRIQNSFDSTNNTINSSKNISIDSSKNDSSFIKKAVANISWDDVKKATDQIQPKYTGTKGIATFENQKALTIDRLATLHSSLETCPTEDMFAETPKSLKVELMPHQKHGLRWLLWRESQKPRGGILADDMGLGKTLSMISLIITTNEMEEDEEEEDESEDERESSWKAKGRKDFYDGGTLIVCPASLIKQWEGEINSKVSRNTLSVLVHHGNNREMKPRRLSKYDVVITTYHIVSREQKFEGHGIFGLKWERIILDEAHTIRNHKAAISVSCCQLMGRRRWALTGTPIQNKEMDMFALLKFLKCSPFDDLTHWKRWIDNRNPGGNVRLNTVIKTLMLRRTKVQLQERGELKCLPEKNYQVVQISLHKEEMNVYQKVLLYSKTLFSQFLHQRAEKESNMYYRDVGNKPTFLQQKDPNGAFNKMHQRLTKMHGHEVVKQHQILVLLLRLRQICCHPGLIDQMLEDDDGNLDMSLDDDPHLDLLEQLNKMKLNDNSENIPEQQVLDEEETTEDQAISRAASKVMLRSNPVFNLSRASSKIKKVLEVLEEKIFHTPDKAVIVSQWTSYLNIIANHLHRKNIQFTRLDGTVPVKDRNDLVVAFNKEGRGPKIMLLSLCAGGVGLNLIGGNHLLLLDLHWNPQLEAQAQDRVYRVGQKKSVFIYQFMCLETVEQKIKALQELKLGIAANVLTGAKNEAGSKLSIDDLKSLFGL